MSHFLAQVLSFAFVTAFVNSAIPYAFAAMGGAVTERSGVIDLALEGKLLFGAFAAAAISYATKSVALGIVAGAAAGMLVAGLQIALALGLGADQVIVGVGINLLGLGGTRFLLQRIFHEGSSSPECPGVHRELLTNSFVWLALVAAVLVPLALRRTRWGLRLRAAGDRPDALISVGIAPSRARLAAAMVGGALAGLGGAHLSLSVGGFIADASAGRGYIALAMVILAGWRPALAALACVGVTFTEAFVDQLQLAGVGIPRELTHLLPYVLTLVVVAIFGQTRPPPKSLGKL